MIGETRMRGIVPVTAVGHLGDAVLLIEEPWSASFEGATGTRRGTESVAEFMRWPLHIDS